MPNIKTLVPVSRSRDGAHGNLPKSPLNIKVKVLRYVLHRMNGNIL